MKLKINESQVNYIYQNVDLYNLTINNVVMIGSLKDRVNKNDGCIYVDEKIVYSMIQMMLTNQLVSNTIFYELCSIYNKFLQSDKVDKCYALYFDIYVQGSKIPAIKMLRDILRSDVFKNMFDRSYSDGLREAKCLIEGGVALGPITKRDAQKLYDIAMCTPVSVRPNIMIVKINAVIKNIVNDYDKVTSLY